MPSAIGVGSATTASLSAFDEAAGTAIGSVGFAAELHPTTTANPTMARMIEHYRFASTTAPTAALIWRCHKCGERGR
jgi:hypothetical protein